MRARGCHNTNIYLRNKCRVRTNKAGYLRATRVCPNFLNQHHAGLTLDSFQPRLDSLHVCFTGRGQVSCTAGAGNLCSRQTGLLSESLQRRDDILQNTSGGVEGCVGCLAHRPRPTSPSRHYLDIRQAQLSFGSEVRTRHRRQAFERTLPQV